MNEPGHPDAAATVRQAMEEPGLYLDGLALLRALEKASGSIRSDTKSANPSLAEALGGRRALSWNTLDSVINENLFHLPQGEDGRVEKPIRDFIYTKFDRFERTPENIRTRVDAVFADSQPAEKFGDFLARLMRANGMESHQVGKSNPMELARKAGLGDTYSVAISQITQNLAQPSYEFLDAVAKSNALSFRTNAEGVVDAAQTDAFFGKAGLKHWRRENLALNVRKVNEDMAAGKISYAGEAMAALLPHMQADSVAKAMLTLNPELKHGDAKLTAGRVQAIRSSNVKMHPAEFNTMFSLAIQEAGVDGYSALARETREALLKLKEIKPHLKSEGFVAAYSQLLATYEREDGTQGISTRQLEENSHAAGETRPRLSRSSFDGLRSGKLKPTVFETVREAVRAFEKGNKRDPVALRADIDDMLSHTPYNYLELFNTPEQYLRGLRGKTGSGELIDHLRIAVGVERGQADFAAAAGISVHALGNYEHDRGVPDAATFEKIIAGVNKALAENHAPPVPDDALDIARAINTANREEWVTMGHGEKMKAGRSQLAKRHYSGR